LRPQPAEVVVVAERFAAAVVRLGQCGEALWAESVAESVMGVAIAVA